MTKEQRSAFLEEKVTLEIPNGAWYIIRSLISDFVNDVGAENLGIDLNEMIMPVFTNKEQKEEWHQKMLQSDKMLEQTFIKILQSWLKDFVQMDKQGLS